jgi:hypothetical protein
VDELPTGVTAVALTGPIAADATTDALQACRSAT